MAPHLTPSEQDAVLDFADKGYTQEQMLEKIAKKRAQRDIEAPTVKVVQRFLRGKTHRRGRVETRGRKKTYSRKNGFDLALGLPCWSSLVENLVDN
jgi:hypothetical protein